MKRFVYFNRALWLPLGGSILFLLLILQLVAVTEAAPRVASQPVDSYYLDIRKKNTFYLDFGVTSNIKSITEDVKEMKIRLSSWGAGANYRFSDRFHGGIEMLSTGSQQHIGFLTLGIDPFGFTNFDIQANAGLGVSYNDIKKQDASILNQEKAAIIHLQAKAAYNGTNNTFAPFIAYRYIHGKKINFSGIEIGLNLNFI